MWRSCDAELVFPPHFLKIVVEVKALGPPHVLRMWLGVCTGMLPMKYFYSYNTFFMSVEVYGDHESVIKLR